MTRAEAARLAAGNPLSFLHVGRSDIDLPETVSPYDPSVYATAKAALDRFCREEILRRDPAPSVYLYEQVWRGRTQTGVVGCVHVSDYEHDIIRKHEKTRPDKEDDRTRHVLTLEANAEPVFLAYRDHAAIDALVARDKTATPVVDFGADAVRHRVWIARDAEPYRTAFADVPLAYVADGHHRSASAWRAGTALREANPAHTGAEEYNWFLAVLFPSSQLAILPYYRVVRTLDGRTAEGCLDAMRALGTLRAEPDAPALEAGSFGCYLGGRWWRLALDPATIDRADPIGSLDAALLQDRVLAPIFGIGDPRTDQRIDFVGGIHGTAELAARVDRGDAAAAFALAPVTMEQLMAVADAGACMPPKSTWFEPKLRSGLFVHTLDLHR